MTVYFDRAYRNAWQQEKPAHDNYVFFYHGKKGYRDWVADARRWKTHGLQNDCFEPYAYLDLNKCDVVEVKPRVVYQDLEPNVEYIVFCKAGDGVTYATVRSTSACGKYFCDPSIISYIPLRNFYG